MALAMAVVVTAAVGMPNSAAAATGAFKVNGHTVLHDPDDYRCYRQSIGFMDSVHNDTDRRARYYATVNGQGRCVDYKDSTPPKSYDAFIPSTEGIMFVLNN
ncbi:hypothetical protein [Actinokineospora fastidiosa]|uniref:hypothetical protein n=1 Tax=Actinokineospora fastidiosa TaxID=1816 RepID=UPI001670AF1E|nr:hypothetical protein [Actinokineospora fastidiosa]